MIGVARGLTYLHSMKDKVVCRGVRSSSILLDHVLSIFDVLCQSPTLSVS